jgi:hypothetical protein
MKRLALAAMLLAGCAATTVATPGRDAKVKELEEKSREIANRAKQCVVAAVKRSGDEMERTKGSASSTKLRMQIAKDEREREISDCKAAEARENEELFSHDRKEYVLQAERERDRTTLMMILTTSRPH